MTLIYDELMASGYSDVPCDYSEKDAMFYALAVGFGSDPLDEQELPYVLESRGPHTVPTMGAMLGYPEYLVSCGWDYNKVLHGEQKLELYRPMPAAAELLLNSSVVSAHDRGAGRGAVLRVVTEGRLKRDDAALFRADSTLIARGDGGFGGPSGSLPSPHRLPHRDADLSCDIQIEPDQALLYRLCGDHNPLHADPVTARAAGFQAPILHGLCSYAVACRAILKTICDYDFTLIREFDVRFSAPVYPGDILTTEMWQDRNVVSFRCSVISRNVVVLKNGKCVLAT